MPIELIPVIEFEPERFAQPPEGKLWKECLTDVGLDHPTPLDETFFVPITNIDKEALKIFLTKLLEDLADDYNAEYIGPIAGGYVLRDEHNIYVWPQCCGDIADITEWQNALAHRLNSWHQIWIGHPCISIKFEHSKLAISTLHEPGDEPKEILIAIHPLDLSLAVAKAHITLTVLHNKIKKLLAPLFTKSQIKEIAKILVYGDYN